MNILLIDTALPSSLFSGKTVRLKNIYGRLAKKERIVYLRTVAVGAARESEELEVWIKKTFFHCARISGPSKAKMYDKVRTVFRLRPWHELQSKFPGEIRQIEQSLTNIIDTFDIDLAVTFDNEVAGYGLILSKRLPWIQDIGDSMVLQMQRQRKHAKSIGWKIDLFWRELRETAFEKEMAGKASATIFVAADDAKIYSDFFPARIDVIPNGVDADYFDPGLTQPVLENKPYVVFTGHMSFLPNQDAVVYFMDSILPILRRRFPDIGFKVVGADAPVWLRNIAENQGVEVTGRVADIRPYLAGASVFVCPMRMGSGIKNKILEAMAMGLPVVATPLAITGFENLPLEAVSIAVKADDFVNSIVKFIENFKQREQAGCQARNFVKENYAWEWTINKYRNLFDRFIKARHAA